MTKTRQILEDHVLNAVDPECKAAAISLYENADLAAAFEAYANAEAKAFESSCSVPSRISPDKDYSNIQFPGAYIGYPFYSCSGIVEESILDDFEAACNEAGGNFEGRYSTTQSACCGDTGDGLFSVYSYATSLPTCLPATAACNDPYTRVHFREESSFEAADQHFESLGLTCRAGCTCGCIGGCNACPRDCAKETATILSTSVDLFQAKTLYYAAVGAALTSCAQAQAINPDGFECVHTSSLVDEDDAGLTQYKEACNALGGILVASDPVEITCAGSISTRIALAGPYACVSEICDPTDEVTRSLVSQDTQLSPVAVFNNLLSNPACESSQSGSVNGNGESSPCTEKTAEFSNNFELASAQNQYHVALTGELSTCLQEYAQQYDSSSQPRSAASHYGCTVHSLTDAYDTAETAYIEACAAIQGRIFRGDDLEATCRSTDGHGTATGGTSFRVSLFGVFVCVSELCKTSEEEARDIVNAAARVSPIGAFREALKANPWCTTETHTSGAGINTVGQCIAAVFAAIVFALF